MRSFLTFGLIGCLIGSAIPLEAAAQATPPQYAEIRRLVRSADGRIDEDGAFLAIDSERREIRVEFEPMRIAIPYGAVSAVHYEKSVEPSKWGWPLTNTRHFLVIHYVEAGRPLYEAVRLSKNDVDRVLSTVEGETHVTIDRTDAKLSFLAIPIRAAIGDLVVVMDTAGTQHEGRITQLTCTSLELDGSGPTPRVFDETTIRSIRRPRPIRHEMTLGLGVGAITGAVTGGLLGAGLGGGAGAAVQGATMVGMMMGGIGLAVSAVVPSYKYRTTRDIYLGR